MNIKKLIVFLITMSVIGCVSRPLHHEHVNPGAIANCKINWQPGCDEYMKKLGR